jgi:hypothetical protein
MPAEMFGGLKKKLVFCFVCPIFGPGEAACRQTPFPLWFLCPIFYGSTIEFGRALFGCMLDCLVGKSVQNYAGFRNYSDSGSFEPRNFHRNFIFLTVKCVPAIS